MRRPVLPSSGQAYDEINIVRHCAGREKQRDPVSGAVLKMRRGKGLQRTPEHLLRNLIFAEALKARVSYLQSQHAAASDPSYTHHSRYERSLTLCTSLSRSAVLHWQCVWAGLLPAIIVLLCSRLLARCVFNRGVLCTPDSQRL